MRTLSVCLSLSLSSIALLSAGCAAGPSEIEVNGRVYALTDMPEGPEAASTERRIEDESFMVVGDIQPLHEWNREDLALALRPVVYDGSGQRYVARSPDWEGADAILSTGGEAGEERSVDWQRRSRRLPADDRVGVSGEELIIGADGRNRVNPTTVDPMRANLRIELYNGANYQGHCSASYIGPWTIVTAAHCILLDGFPVTNRIVFKQAQNGSILPYGSYDCRNYDASSSNDILISHPAGWTGNFASQTAFDYAVIDTFPCMPPTSNTFAGYLVNSGSASYDVYGYPGDICPGAPAPERYLCGMAGSAYVNEHMIESEHVDIIAGQSGGPWYRLIDGYRVAGITSGERTYFDLFRCGFSSCVRNFSRRIDGTVDAFIRATSYDF